MKLTPFIQRPVLPSWIFAPASAKKSDFAQAQSSAVAQAANQDIPKRTDQRSSESPAVRVCSFNIHFATDNFLQPSAEHIVKALAAISADVLCLQEIPLPTRSTQGDELKMRLHDLGYPHCVYSDTCFTVNERLNPERAKSLGFQPYDCGAAVFSKYPIASSAVIGLETEEYRQKWFNETRQAVVAIVQVPLSAQGKDNQFVNLGLSSLHLDAFTDSELGAHGADQVRLDEFMRIHQWSQSIVEGGGGGSQTDVLPDCMVVMGDFNSESPAISSHPIYSGQYKLAEVADIWRGIPSSYDFLEQVERRLGYTHAWQAASLIPPACTHWSGKAIDHILISPCFTGATVEVSGTYVYHTAASDHLPMIADLRLAVPTNA